MCKILVQRVSRFYTFDLHFQIKCVNEMFKNSESFTHFLWSYLKKIAKHPVNKGFLEKIYDLSGKHRTHTTGRRMEDLVRHMEKDSLTGTGELLTSLGVPAGTDHPPWLYISRGYFYIRNRPQSLILSLM
jgi:hypothetical protein